MKQLADPNNNEAEVELFINALRWRFSGRDHQALSSLQLFETLHKSQKLKAHWGKPVQTDFDIDKTKPDLKFKFTVNA